MAEVNIIKDIMQVFNNKLLLRCHRKDNDVYNVEINSMAELIKVLQKELDVRPHMLFTIAPANASGLIWIANVRNIEKAKRYNPVAIIERTDESGVKSYDLLLSLKAKISKYPKFNQMILTIAKIKILKKLHISDLAVSWQEGIKFPGMEKSDKLIIEKESHGDTSVGDCVRACNVKVASLLKEAKRTLDQEINFYIENKINIGQIHREVIGLENAHKAFGFNETNTVRGANVSAKRGIPISFFVKNIENILERGNPMNKKDYDLLAVGETSLHKKDLRVVFEAIIMGANSERIKLLLDAGSEIMKNKSPEQKAIYFAELMVEVVSNSSLDVRQTLLAKKSNITEIIAIISRFQETGKIVNNIAGNFTFDS